MLYRKIFFVMILIFTGTILVSNQLQSTEDISILVNDSGPFIGTSIPHQSGYDGNGITISIIDTGIDLNHPDLDGQIIGGYDFIDDDEMPEDINGHGTQVAGIIASNGNLKGIAPNSKILMYKVSEDGESVPTELIVKAIEKSIEDNVDIINISLGINQTNTKIDQAVNKAVKNNIFVVTAAGNFGPELNTIGKTLKVLSCISKVETILLVTLLNVAPTVITFGFIPGLPIVLNSGPKFPAAVTTKILFFTALFTA